MASEKMVDKRITTDDGFKRILQNVRHKFIMRGLTPPSTKKITKMLVQTGKIKEEDILYYKAFRFR